MENGPHGELTIVFTNFNGKVLLKESKSPEIQKENSTIYYFQYDGRGNVTHAYKTKCVISYTVKIGTSTPADLSLAKYVRNGASGNLITLEQTTYEKRQVDSRTHWYLSTSTQYPDKTGANGNTTRFSYVDHPNSLQISQRTTILPDSATRMECYDVASRNTWQKNELGIITYHQYDAISGLETRTIQDADTTKTSDFTTPVPNGWSTAAGAGKHLISEVKYDWQGLVTQALGAINECVNVENQSVMARSARWTIYDDANHKIISANGFVEVDETGNVLSETLANPVNITIYDATGRFVEAITTRRISTSGKLAATDTFLPTDYLSWSIQIYAGDQLVEKRDYFNIPATGSGEESVHYNATHYSYDTYGRHNLVISPDGTITKTVFDWQNNPPQTWLGTSPSDLTLVTETIYGGEDGGCPTCTGTTAKPRLTIQYADADTMRITEYGYDWRGRRIHVHYEEDTDGLSTYSLTTYDNLDRSIKSERYLSLAPSPDRLLACTETFYDSHDNVWKTEQSIVNPADGTVQGKLLAQNGFDASGRTIQSKPLGENRVTVTTYDSIGRAIRTDVTLPDDTVYQQTDYIYHNSGHMIFAFSADRLPNQTGRGTLFIDTEPKGRYHFIVNWYDGAGRSIASADYGTNGGELLFLPSTIPLRSDVILLTETFYDQVTGRDSKRIDPAGKETRTFVDALGRTTQTVANFVTGTPSVTTPDCNVTVLYTYPPSGQAETMTVKNPAIAYQTTCYEYSLGLLTQEFYPDSISPTDCVSYTYNRLGERTSKRDQNGTVHEYIYDNLGRILHERITDISVGVGIDSAVRRISTSYNANGQIASLTSWNNPTVCAGSTVNEITYDYNACGLLSKEFSNPSGVVTALSKYIGYNYDMTKSGNYFTKNLRPTGLTYPNGDAVTNGYGTNDSPNNALNRPVSVQHNNATVAAYTYQGVRTPVITDCPQVTLNLDFTNAAALDRFDRITRQMWKGVFEINIVDIEHGYDRSGNRTYRWDYVANVYGKTLSEIYTYDGMNQLIARFVKPNISITIPPATGSHTSITTSLKLAPTTPPTKS